MLLALYGVYVREENQSPTAMGSMDTDSLKSQVLGVARKHQLAGSAGEVRHVRPRTQISQGSRGIQTRTSELNDHSILAASTARSRSTNRQYSAKLQMSRDLIGQQ